VSLVGVKARYKTMAGIDQKTGQNQIILHNSCTALFSVRPLLSYPIALTSLLSYPLFSLTPSSLILPALLLLSPLLPSPLLPSLLSYPLLSNPHFSPTLSSLSPLVLFLTLSSLTLSSLILSLLSYPLSPLLPSLLFNPLISNPYFSLTLTSLLPPPLFSLTLLLFSPLTLLSSLVSHPLFYIPSYNLSSVLFFCFRGSIPRCGERRRIGTGESSSGWSSRTRQLGKR